LGAAQYIRWGACILQDLVHVVWSTLIIGYHHELVGEQQRHALLQSCPVGCQRHRALTAAMESLTDTYAVHWPAIVEADGDAVARQLLSLLEWRAERQCDVRG
jgi:hypothetical protein